MYNLSDADYKTFFQTPQFSSMRKKAEWKKKVIGRLESVFAADLSTHSRNTRIVTNAITRLVDHDDPSFYQAVFSCKKFPVTIEEFVESPEFLGNIAFIWDKVKPEIYRMNPDFLAGEMSYDEVILGGATATAKTTCCQISTMYDLYCLWCINKPQKIFSLTDQTPIILTVQSVSPTVTNRVIYKPLRQMFLSMPFVIKHVNYDRDKERELLLEGNLQLIPLGAKEEAILGQATIGGILDEINFFSVVENSTLIPGMGGRYDQAEIVYDSLQRRKKGRFTSSGIKMGRIFVSSSIRYKEDFISRRIKEVRELELDKPIAERGNQQGKAINYNVYLSMKKQYEVQPDERYKSGESFPLLVGTTFYPTRVLSQEEYDTNQYPTDAHIEFVPEEYRLEFLSDPENALRDVVGYATDTISPFIAQRHKIIDAIKRGVEKYNLKKWVSRDEIVLSKHSLPSIIANNLPDDKEAIRALHVDLSLVSDRVGIAITKLLPFKEVETINSQGDKVTERLPEYLVEMVLTVEPDQNNRIDISDIRRWITSLKNNYNVPIKIVSYDGFQSAESIQIFRKQRIRSFVTSVDRSSEPYKYFRTALYQDRVHMIGHDIARVELANLEYNAEKDRIDHPLKGTGKDAADAIVGSIWSLHRTYGLKGTHVVEGEERSRRKRTSGRRKSMRRK